MDALLLEMETSSLNLHIIGFVHSQGLKLTRKSSSRHGDDRGSRGLEACGTTTPLSSSKSLLVLRRELLQRAHVLGCTEMKQGNNPTKIVYTTQYIGE